jgi:hypothetical protein
MQESTNNTSGWDMTHRSSSLQSVLILYYGTKEKTEKHRKQIMYGYRRVGTGYRTQHVSHVGVSLHRERREKAVLQRGFVFSAACRHSTSVPRTTTKVLYGPTACWVPDILVRPGSEHRSVARRRPAESDAGAT